MAGLRSRQPAGGIENMKKTATLLGVALLAASMMLGAIACSDDDDDGGTDNTPVATSTEAVSDTPEATEGDTTPAEGAAVSVNLTEYIVSANPASVAAGPVTFTAKNIGGTEHELVVIKTDLAPESLPTGDDGSVDEAGEGIEVIDEVEELAAGDEGEISVDLEAGAYVLICNVVEQTDNGTVIHYAKGMHAAFTVE